MTGLETACWAEGANVIAHEHTFRLTATAGKPARIFTYAHFHRDCSAGPAPHTTFRTSPSHGTVEARREPSTVKTLRVGAADCSGRIYDGLGLYYTPAAGFRGTDQFDWIEDGGEHPYHDTAIVTVR